VYKLLVAIFNNETAAGAGLNALRALHASGDTTRCTPPA
jgi:hypothetical protein